MITLLPSLPFLYIHSNKKGKAIAPRTGLNYNVENKWACWTLYRIVINSENGMTKRPTLNISEDKKNCCTVEFFMYIVSFLTAAVYSLFSEREDAGIVRVSCDMNGISGTSLFSYVNLRISNG